MTPSHIGFLMEVSPDPVVSYGRDDGRILAVNAAGVKLFGADGPVELIGRSMMDLVHPGSHDSIRALGRSGAPGAGQTEGNAWVPATILRLDGAQREVEAFSPVAAHADGANVLLFLRDATGRQDGLNPRETPETQQRLAQEWAGLAEIGRVVTSSLDMDLVYERFSREMRKLIPFDWISTNTIDFQRGVTTNEDTRGVDVPQRRRGYAIPIAGSITEEMVRRRSGILVQPDNEAELARQFPPLVPSYQAGLRSFMAVLLIWNEEIIGTLHLRSKTRHAFTAQDLALAESIGHQIAGAIATLRLYRQRLEAEEELRASEARYRDLYQEAPSAYYSIGLDGRIQEANSSAARLFGYSREALIGMPIFDLYPETPLGGKKILDVVDRFRAGVEVSGEEMEVLRSDGETRWVSLSVRGIRDEEGRIVASRSIAVDITDRKRAEEALEGLRRRHELILNSAGEGICGIDAEGNITFLNPAAAAMTGWGDEELAGKPLHQILHHSAPDGTSYPPEDCPIQGCLGGGHVCQADNEVFWRKDGTSFPVEYVSNPIRDEGDELVGAVVTFKDITERREMDRMKDEFISVVSHELRTPLTSIRGSLGLVAGGVMGALPERAQHMMEIAVSNTDRLVRLINDILDIERMESGRATMQMKVCGAGQLMEQAVEVMRDMARRADVTLSVSPLSAQVLADPDRIIQTLTNLLSNAIKFSPSGATVSLGAQPRGQHLEFAVRDQGRGIPQDKLATVFERFQQVDSSDAREKGGTGLGLSICRTIVQQHGGSIWAESTPGEGSTFYFTVPSAADALPEVTLDAASGPKVLLCDDDPSVLDVVGSILAQRGYRVVTASSGAEALVKAPVERPDVILLDLVMPNMSGWETMAALQEGNGTRDIPIVIITGTSGQEAGPARSTAAGWLTKPVDEGSLFHELEKAVAGHAKVGRVLLVEDDPDLAQVLLAVFDRHGIETHHARTGREAVELSERLLPDLLILDLVLPEGDGFFVVDWLRRHDRLRLVPLVVYSVRDLDDSERKRLRLGQTEFFTKGRVSPEDFERRVLQLLSGITRTPTMEGADVS